MDAQRFVFKVYADDHATVSPHAVVKVFHEWVQTRRLEEVHIDVADYSHVPDGPGVMLICHHANYSLDRLDRRLGLTYNRKRDATGTVAERIASALRMTLTACRNLEEDPSLREGLRFSTKELLFRVNDRLLGPNTKETENAYAPELRALCKRLYGDASVEIERVSQAPEDVFTLRVRASSGPPSTAALLERL